MLRFTNQKKSLYNVGPDYLGSFDDTEISADGINKSIFFNYNAKACEGNICYDNSPTQSRETTLNAKLSSVILCVTRDVFFFSSSFF